MSDVRPLLWLIPTLPLLAAALITFGFTWAGPLRRHAHWPCIIAAAGSFVAALLVFIKIYHGGEEPLAIAEYGTWFRAGDASAGGPTVDVPFSLRADALTGVMTVMVTFISTFIAIYSAGYMADDPGYPRFFAEVSLFIFSMTLLVLGNNLLLLYFGWEGVGVCSYLLIGYWFNRPAAAQAARKAFLVTRIGDVGLMIGILVLWVNTGYKLDYQSIFEFYKDQPQGGVVVTTACLLLFCGAAGKSAQFPLHVWLPDAMEGPTPVSALIHAATMVTAGVYLVARFSPLFVLAPMAQAVVGGIGAFTALLAALIALTQTDLKRVLAYSTLSQLGYMFLALGSGLGKDLIAVAVVAAIFHLFTHAFFKALLFLSAGSVMHGMGGVIDMRRFSGLARVMPQTHITFLCGALALAGLPFLSGFWSKDEILSTVHAASEVPGSLVKFPFEVSYATYYLLLLISGIVTAFLTAFYTFRAYFMTFWGPEKIPEEAFSHAHGGGHGGHGHGDVHGAMRHDSHHSPEPTPTAGVQSSPHGNTLESPWAMTLPLWVLSIFALGVGVVLGPTGLFSHFLERMPLLPKAPPESMNLVLMSISGALALLGIGLAYVMYVQQPALPTQLAHSIRALYELSYNKFHIDEIYAACIVIPLAMVAAFIRAFDLYFIDGLVDLLAQVPRMLGYLFRPVQNGLVQFYGLAMVLGLTIFLVALIWNF
jgi:proton-translocating NADH-quinone oxidoreductase chain L